MGFLQSRPGKATLICLLRLPAVGCFGLLESSGVVDNGAVQLGGAFAGFNVTLYVLNRTWGHEDDLEQRAISAGSAPSPKEGSVLAAHWCLGELVSRRPS